MAFSLPYERSPIRWNNAILQSLSNHALMRFTSPKCMATPTERSQVTHRICSTTRQLQNVIDMCLFQRKAERQSINTVGSLAFSLISFPNTLPLLHPNFSKWSAISFHLCSACKTLSCLVTTHPAVTSLWRAKPGLTTFCLALLTDTPLRSVG